MDFIRAFDFWRQWNEKFKTDQSNAKSSLEIVKEQHYKLKQVYFERFSHFKFFKSILKHFKYSIVLITSLKKKEK